VTYFDRHGLLPKDEVLPRLEAQFWK